MERILESAAGPARRAAQGNRVRRGLQAGEAAIEDVDRASGALEKEVAPRRLQGFRQ